MEDDFKNMELDLMLKAQRAEELVVKINKIRDEIPDDEKDAERIRNAWAEAERELFKLVGEDEFKRLTGRDYFKGDL